MKFFCIADEVTVRGFRLAGVEGQVVVSPSETVAALESAMRKPDWGVIVLTQQVAAAIDNHIERLRLRQESPLIVEIPGPQGPIPGRKGLRQVVQEAVGIRVT